MLPDEVIGEPGRDYLTEFALGPLPLDQLPQDYLQGELARLQRHFQCACVRSLTVPEGGVAELNLAHCVFGLSQIQALVDVLPLCTCLKTLKLTNNALDSTQLSVLVAGLLGGVQSLEALDLSHNRLGPQCGEVGLAWLGRVSLQKIQWQSSRAGMFGPCSAFESKRAIVCIASAHNHAE